MLRYTVSALGQARYATRLQMKLLEGDMAKLLKEVEGMGVHGEFIASELSKTMAELKGIYQDAGAEQVEVPSGGDDDAKVKCLVGKAFQLYPLHVAVPHGFRKASFSEVSPYLAHLKTSITPGTAITTSDSIVICPNGEQMVATDISPTPTAVVLTPTNPVAPYQSPPKKEAPKTEEEQEVTAPRREPRTFNTSFTRFTCKRATWMKSAITVGVLCLGHSCTGWHL